ncbi:alpha-amylase family protein [Dactylosporangium sp. NPDC049525]|uniref:alpha-amylase family protein n=1 Tax=Dactylosporangium sp. NPDC049525 TaxID=3154730 RepID=UPI0034371966
MGERWYTESVIYCLDVETFQDSNGDGIGDFQGLISRLDYLTRLGINCLWLHPIHPTPGRDDGYDATDFYNVDPRLGTLGDFAELLHEAANRGIKVIIDLVVNHTSDEHPWFQSAVASKDSPYRDWFVWADKEPADRFQGMVFPGEQAETWTYHRKARAWYYHRFYDFQPDLNFANPLVRTEVKKILAFWIQLGVAGFRMDAVPFIIELTEPGNSQSPMDFDYLSELRQHIQWRRGDAVLLAEANVEPEKLPEYFGDAGGSANRIHMLFDFMLNGRLVLALARQNPEPVIDWLKTTPKLPPGGQWATFLRNHDEIDLSRLTAEQREDVFEQFGPDEDMRLYDRGIRRRLGPMLGGDRSRLELAYSLQFTLRGTPVLRYGEEIGMGEDLTQAGRYAIRTPMQWSYATNSGFSDAEPIRPVISKGEYGYETVNVTAQRRDPASLLAWFERMIRTLRESPEVGGGTCACVDQPMPAGVLAHRADGPTGSMLFLHNLGTEEVTVDLGNLAKDTHLPNDVFANQEYEPVGDFTQLQLSGYGYRWIRLRRSNA